MTFGFWLCVGWQVTNTIGGFVCSKIITNKMTLMDYPLFQG